MRTEQLRELVRDEGPFVSVYVDASHDTEDATTQNELRWRAMESDLRDGGADQATIEAAKALAGAATATDGVAALLRY